MDEDLKKFLERLESEHNLVKRFSKKMELRSIACMIYEQNTSNKILLFENVSGFKGKILANTVAN